MKGSIMKKFLIAFTAVALSVAAFTSVAQATVPPTDTVTSTATSTEAPACITGEIVAACSTLTPTPTATATATPTETSIPCFENLVRPEGVILGVQCTPEATATGTATPVVVIVPNPGCGFTDGQHLVCNRTAVVITAPDTGFGSAVGGSDHSIFGLTVRLIMGGALIFGALMIVWGIFRGAAQDTDSAVV